MLKKAYQAYDTNSTETMSGREIEARVLTKAAMELKNCQTCWESEERKSLLEKALTYNQQVWNLFQLELSHEDNPLPTKLKQDLLNLSLFIDRRTFEIMADPEINKLTSLININLNIASGLRGSAVG